MSDKPKYAWAFFGDIADFKVSKSHFFDKKKIQILGISHDGLWAIIDQSSYEVIRTSVLFWNEKDIDDYIDKMNRTTQIGDMILCAKHRLPLEFYRSKEETFTGIVTKINKKSVTATFTEIGVTAPVKYNDFIVISKLNPVCND